MSNTVRVHGFREMSRAFTRADKELKKDLTNTLKEVAEPVRAEAERKALREIRNIGPKWSRMRTGSTQRMVYVAPKTRGKTGQKRPGLAPLLMDRAMQPALDSHTNQIEQEFNHMLDDIARHWGRGG